MPPQVRAEGLTERLGDIRLQCSGTPGAEITGNLGVLLPVPVTNRITAGGATSDVTLALDTGSGPLSTGLSAMVTPQGLTFNGLSFAVPAGGNLTLSIGGIRANVTGMAQMAPINAFLSFTGNLSVTNNPVAVGTALPGLLASISAAGIPCAGSPAPDTVSLSGLFGAGTNFASSRFTEGFASAFEPKTAGSDSGTRILVSYSGFAAGARLFVPTAIAGSDAAQPTAGGDLGLPRSGGQYTAGSGTLLLSLVSGADASGAGGTPLLDPATVSGTATLDGAAEIPLANGSGTAVYEVMDSNGAVRESAQFPTFVAYNPAGNTGVTFGQEAISPAPVSTVGTASTSAPIPRFIQTTPATDCTILSDCSSSIFPHLSLVNAPAALSFTATAGGRPNEQPVFVKFTNSGGGILNWTDKVSYQSGAGWVNLVDMSIPNDGSIQVFVKPQGLAPGTYQAALNIDAGAAGSANFPITLAIAAPPVPTPAFSVSGIVNGASFQPGISAGALATIQGQHLAGKSASVTFDGMAASLLYSGDSQINLLVPAALAGRASVQMVVTVDGVASAPQAVALAALAPAVFHPGILNQDYSVNGPSAPAKPGSVIQVFATGLPTNGTPVSAKIQDRDNLVPLYAGAAPGLPGVEQVNVQVPADLPAGNATLLLCATGADGQRVCSPQATLVVGGE